MGKSDLLENVIIIHQKVEEKKRCKDNPKYKPWSQKSLQTLIYEDKLWLSLQT